MEILDFQFTALPFAAARPSLPINLPPGQLAGPPLGSSLRSDALRCSKLRRAHQSAAALIASLIDLAFQECRICFKAESREFGPQRGIALNIAWLVPS